MAHERQNNAEKEKKAWSKISRARAKTGYCQRHRRRTETDARKGGQQEVRWLSCSFIHSFIHAFICPASNNCQTLFKALGI